MSVDEATDGVEQDIRLVQDPLQRALLRMLGRQADAMEGAGEATAREIRALGNRFMLIVVLAMGLNTALVVGSMRLGVSGDGAELRVDGVDAANAVAEQVTPIEVPVEAAAYPPPMSMPHPLPVEER